MILPYRRALRGARSPYYTAMKSSQAPVRISACLIVRNEEVMLPDCLRSLLHAVHEIVVVDTGSTDTTVAIAEEFGCVVVHEPWADDFAAARNVSLQHATSEWVVVIDADERLVNADQLRFTVANSLPTTGGYTIDVESPSIRSDGSVDIYTTSVLRLFRNHPAVQFYGAIHEQVVDTVLRAGYSIARSAVRFSHLGYNLSPAEMQSKQQRNLALLTTALAKQPNDGYTILQRGKTLLALGQPEEALKDFTAVTSQQANASASIQALAFSYSGIVYYRAALYHEALRHAEKSLTMLPGQALAYYITGEAWTALGNFDAALDAYLRMRTNYRLDDVQTALAGDYRLPDAPLAFRIGRSYAGLKQWGRAEEEFRNGLQADPRDIGCLVGCAEVALRRNNPHEALRLLHTAMEIAPDRQDIQQYAAIAQTQADSEAELPPAAESTLVLAGAMIIGDNPKGLERALASLVSTCDTTTVVHTGVDPAIRDYLQRTATRVVVHPWQDDFSEARNMALRHCQGDWVLVLDSDEYISEKAAGEIRRAMASASQSVGGLLLGITHTTADNTTPGGAVLRLFRCLPSVYYEGFVHEQVTMSITRLGMSVQERTDIVIQHYPAPMDAQKYEQYHLLLSREIERLGNAAEWPLFQYALLLFNFGSETELVESLLSLDAYLKHPLMRRDNAAVLLNSYARHVLAQEDWLRLAGIAEDSLALFPDQREAWWHAARAYSQLKDWPHCFYALRMLCSSYDERHRNALVFEQEPTVEDIISEGRRAALLSDHSEIRDLIEVFAMRHGYSIPDTLATPAAEQSAPTVPAERPLLSVSMIVKNEEKFLPGCLESVRSIADEIVIADTGSTDATVAIAQSYGAVVVHTSWEGDFARARNVSLERCTGRWVLYIDADERLEASQREYIRALTAFAPDDVGAFLCTIVSPHRQRDNSVEQHSGAYPRLFRNLGYPAVQFHGRVHEQVSPSILAAGKTLAPSDVVIHHLGYEQSVEVMHNKVQRNFDLLMRHIREEPTNGQAWLHLGFTLAFMGKNTEAEESLRFALKLGNLNPHLEASAASTLAQIAGSARKFVDALYWAEYSLSKAPQQLYALHLRAFALLYLQRFEEAEQAFTEVLYRIDHPQKTQAGFDINIKRETVLDGLRKAQMRFV